MSNDKESEARREAMRERLRRAREGARDDSKAKGDDKKTPAAAMRAAVQRREARQQEAEQRKEAEQRAAAERRETRQRDAQRAAPARPAASAGKPAAGRSGRPINRPLPPPPARQRTPARPVSPEISPDAQKEIDALIAQFTGLESSAQLSGVYQAIGQIDSQLIELPMTVEALRLRGYVHAGGMEKQIDTYTRQWEELRPRVESTLSEQVNRLTADLEQASRRMDRISSGSAAALTAAKTSVEGLSNRIDGASRAIEALYQNLNRQLRQLNLSINRVTWMMDQLDAAPEISLYPSEGPLIAVNAQWHRDGRDGPDGILFLTDQRFLFEQREEVVTRRTLGIFRRESEKIQKLLLDIDISEIESVSHSKEGGFIGIGRADILELIFTGRAPIARGRFHLKGQDSALWAGYIKRAQLGDIDKDRHEAYIEELESAASVTFPTQCPNCFAAVPPPTRGARHASCEFCGTVIAPDEDE